MVSKAWVKWTAPGAAVLVAAMATAVDASAARKAIAALLTFSGTGCQQPPNGTYTGIAEGLDASGNVLCTAYTVGSTSWQYCTGTGVACTPGTPTQVRGSLALTSSTDFSNITTYCVGQPAPWVSGGSGCGAIFGNCTVQVTAGGAN